jgi:hypothetical protein
MPTPQTEYRMKAAVLASAKARFKNLEGRRFGKLFVLRKSETRLHGHTSWVCVCDCDLEKEIVKSGTCLLSGDTSSCGCYHKEQLALRRTSHGQTRGGKHSEAYACWANMVQRCTNPKATNWKYWGGRGITICDSWRQFENFHKDMGDPPEGLTLDRYPDLDGNYEPGNCRWATDEQQSQNRRLRSDNKTGRKGVTIAYGRKYRAVARVDGKNKHIGYFPLTPDGLQAADEACIKARQISEVLS